jgi:polyhydroxybutyrate depolymerase
MFEDEAIPRLEYSFDGANSSRGLRISRLHSNPSASNNEAMFLRVGSVVVLCLGSLIGCSTGSEPSDTPGAGGGAAAGTSGSSAGVSGSSAGTGGSGPSTAGNAGAGGAGAGASAGGATSGGMTGGGMGGVTTGGSSTGGTGGGGALPGAKPSAGCTAGMKPAAQYVGVNGSHFYGFPSNYDGKTPLPVLMGFHGCGSSNYGKGLTAGSPVPDTEFIRQTTKDFGETYVRAIPVSSSTGGCWSDGPDLPRVTKVYDDLLANYCVDTSRVFATGHSSGSQFLVRLLANKTAAAHFNFKGVAPVAADPAAVAVPMPVMYIDGQMDNQRSADSAKNTVAAFRKANMCADTSKPYAPVMHCKSGQDGSDVDPGCIIYDQCTVPTIWCAHNDPDYNNTQHGIPCFGMKAAADFFKTL